jgi:hypothetical protein
MQETLVVRVRRNRGLGIDAPSPLDAALVLSLHPTASMTAVGTMPSMKYGKMATGVE